MVTLHGETDKGCIPRNESHSCRQPDAYRDHWTQPGERSTTEPQHGTEERQRQPFRQGGGHGGPSPEHRGPFERCLNEATFIEQQAKAHAGNDGRKDEQHVVDQVLHEVGEVCRGHRQGLQGWSSQQPVFRTRTLHDGLLALEREGAHAQGKHQQGQVNADAQLVPTEGALVDVRHLGRAGADQELQADGRHRGDERQEQGEEDDLARLSEIHRFAPFLEKHRTERGPKGRPAASRFVEVQPRHVR